MPRNWIKLSSGEYLNTAHMVSVKATTSEDGVCIKVYMDFADECGAASAWYYSGQDAADILAWFDGLL